MVTLVTIETGSTVHSLHVTFQSGLVSQRLTTNFTCERLAVVLVASVLLKIIICSRSVLTLFTAIWLSMIPSYVCIQKRFGFELVVAKCARKVRFQEAVFASSYVIESPVLYLFTIFRALPFKEVFIFFPANSAIITNHLDFLIFSEFLTSVFPFLTSVSVGMVSSKLGHKTTVNADSAEGLTSLADSTRSSNTAISCLFFLVQILHLCFHPSLYLGLEL